MFDILFTYKFKNCRKTYFEGTAVSKRNDKIFIFKFVLC